MCPRAWRLPFFRFFFRLGAPASSGSPASTYWMNVNQLGGILHRGFFLACAGLHARSSRSRRPSPTSFSAIDQLVSPAVATYSPVVASTPDTSRARPRTPATSCCTPSGCLFGRMRKRLFHAPRDICGSPRWNIGQGRSSSSTGPAVSVPKRPWRRPGRPGAPGVPSAFRRAAAKPPRVRPEDLGPPSRAPSAFCRAACAPWSAPWGRPSGGPSAWKPDAARARPGRGAGGVVTPGSVLVSAVNCDPSPMGVEAHAGGAAGAVGTGACGAKLV